jgi:four helix bundle protein
VTRNGAFARDLSLVHQLRRASLSILSNIAEGFERGTNAEFVQFLYTAKGSSGEVRAQLSIAFDQQYISQKDYAELLDLCRRISGMIGNLIGHLRQPQFSGRRKVKLQQKRSETDGT